MNQQGQGSKNKTKEVCLYIFLLLRLTFFKCLFPWHLIYFCDSVSIYPQQVLHATGMELTTFAVVKWVIWNERHTRWKSKRKQEIKQKTKLNRNNVLVFIYLFFSSRKFHPDFRLGFFFLVHVVVVRWRWQAFRSFFKSSTHRHQLFVCKRNPFSFIFPASFSSTHSKGIKKLIQFLHFFSIYFFLCCFIWFSWLQGFFFVSKMKENTFDPL